MTTTVRLICICPLSSPPGAHMRVLDMLVKSVVGSQMLKFSALGPIRVSIGKPGSDTFKGADGAEAGGTERKE